MECRQKKDTVLPIRWHTDDCNCIVDIQRSNSRHRIAIFKTRFAMQSPYEYISKVYNYLIFSGLCGQFLGASLSANKKRKSAPSLLERWFSFFICNAPPQAGQGCGPKVQIPEREGWNRKSPKAVRPRASNCLQGPPRRAERDVAHCVRQIPEREEFPSATKKAPQSTLKCLKFFQTTLIMTTQRYKRFLKVPYDAKETSL